MSPPCRAAVTGGSLHSTAAGVPSVLPRLGIDPAAAAGTLLAALAARGWAARPGRPPGARARTAHSEPVAARRRKLATPAGGEKARPAGGGEGDRRRPGRDRAGPQPDLEGARRVAQLHAVLAGAVRHAAQRVVRRQHRGGLAVDVGPPPVAGDLAEDERSRAATAAGRLNLARTPRHNRQGSVPPVGQPGGTDERGVVAWRGKHGARPDTHDGGATGAPRAWRSAR